MITQKNINATAFVAITSAGQDASCWLDQDDDGAGGAVDVLIGSTKAVRTAVQTRNAPQRIQIPQQPANTKISCRLSDSTAGALTCDVSFEGHYYA